MLRKIKFRTNLKNLPVKEVRIFEDFDSKRRRPVWYVEYEDGNEISPRINTVELIAKDRDTALFQAELLLGVSSDKIAIE